MATNEHRQNNEEPVHISVVLDRSGSMGHIASDIVGGFNQFLAEQRSQQGNARMTLAQFDSQDPFEVLIDAVDLQDATDLDRSAYQPRDATPLYDAVGRMISRIDAQIARRAEDGAPAEDQVVVIITDGLENASHEQTHRSIFEMIEQRRRDGWVFVYLGANQDVYAEGARMSVPQGNTKPWVPTKGGTQDLFSDVSSSTTEYRSKDKARRLADADEFYPTPREQSEPPLQR